MNLHRNIFNDIKEMLSEKFRFGSLSWTDDLASSAINCNGGGKGR
jgi:hypothetical protein